MISQDFKNSKSVINTAMLGLVQIQIWLESPAVLILGSGPNVALAATNSTTISSLQITRSAGVIPQRSNRMEGWLDLVDSSGLQLMSAPPMATTTATLTISNYLMINKDLRELDKILPWEILE